MGARCATCVWVHRFDPRDDERARGLTLGCKKPGWEGYTSDDNPACGGCFYISQPECRPNCACAVPGDPGDGCYGCDVYEAKNAAATNVANRSLRRRGGR